MDWIWPGDNFSPFAIEEWSKGLSATHGAQQMAPARMLEAMSCCCILKVWGGGPVTDSNTHLWRDQTTISLGKSHPVFNVHMMSNIFLPSGVYLRPPEESWHKHLPYCRSVVCQETRPVSQQPVGELCAGTVTDSGSVVAQTAAELFLSPLMPSGKLRRLLCC